MNAYGWTVLILVILLPLLWVASEFQSRRWLRLFLGSSALLIGFGVAFIVGTLNNFKYNAWYGHTTKQLIDTTVTELEAGRTEAVLSELKLLQDGFYPTYENRADYNVLVEKTVSRMKNPDASSKSAE